MKLSSLLSRKKLRSTTARRSLGAPDDMDYEEMSEPNMKLSRALLIVLVLHVVAVAGIIAFNTIKNRQGPAPVTKSTSNAATSQTATPKSNAPAVATSDSSSVPRDETASRSTPKPAVKEERKAIPVKPAAENSPKAESRKTYVVAKGDNPVTIARKFKISSDELLTANKIEDPHKLKIGQKLIIPTKATKPKKGD
jgi:LysM repeat protein